MATDWVTISALATAGGTLVLAIATFASVRSANHAARVAERSLLAALRPVLTSSRIDDPPQKVGFQDDRWLRVEGGRGAAEVTDGAIYLAMSVRNVGQGMAVLHGWQLHLGDRVEVSHHVGEDVGEFRRLTRDLYVAPGEIGFWQGAFRDPTDPQYEPVATAIRERRPMSVEVLYGDHEGGQRVVTLFSMVPNRHADAAPPDYFVTTARHRNIDRNDPR